VEGTSNEGSDGFRFGDDGVATAKGSGTSLSCACNLAIFFRRSSCLRRSSSILLLEDSMALGMRRVLVTKLNKRDALFGRADRLLINHILPISDSDI
jgi:hypothetical protein